MMIMTVMMMTLMILIMMITMMIKISLPVCLPYQAADGLPHARLVELDVLLQLARRDLCSQIFTLFSQILHCFWHLIEFYIFFLIKNLEHFDNSYLQLTHCLLHLRHQLKKIIKDCHISSYYYS